MSYDLGASPMNNFTPSNYRSADIFGGNYPLQTPAGIVHTSQPTSNTPPLPPRPQSLYQQQQPSMFSNSGWNSYGSSFGGGGFGSYGMGMGGMGFNSFGGMGGYGMNRGGFGGMPMDPETRFIQMAEESSRGAFQSIEQVVSLFGNIATMLDSTYFALTSSFRAILGLAANFSQMRGFLTKFFSGLTIFRTAIWIYRKLLFMMGLSKTNPRRNVDLNEAFKEAEIANAPGDFFAVAASQQSGGSGLSMLLFIAFIFSAPYLIMKVFGSLVNSEDDKTKNPAAWVNPIDAVVMYNFNGENQSELTVRAGQHVKVAPRDVQQMNRLLATNWVMATVDGKRVGLVPVNYIKKLETSQLPANDIVADVTMEPVLQQQQPEVTTTTTAAEKGNESNC